jgi:hypothetical protein
MPDGSPSLDLILDEAHRLIDVQLRHFEALDTRSGIVIGFAGTTVALARGGNIFTSIGRGLAATAALFALLGFVPRWFASIDLRDVRDKYARAEPAVTQAELVSAHLAVSELARREAEAKMRRLGVAAGLLVAAVFFVAIGGS